MSTLEQYLPQIIASAIVIALLPISKYITKKITMQYSLIMRKSELRLSQVKQVIFTILNIIFVFLIAVIWGVQPENLLIALSSIFAVIGVALFAQWSILSNVTAGIIMFFTAPFRIGDTIHIIDKDLPIDATIENIKGFYTYLRTEKGELIVIPNNLFLQKMVSFNHPEDDM